MTRHISRSRRGVLIATVATALVPLALTGCSDSGDTTAASAEAGSSTTPGSPHSAHPMRVRPVPALSRTAKHAKKVTANPDDITHADRKATNKGLAVGKIPARFKQANKNHNTSTKTIKPSSMSANRLYIPSAQIYASIVPEGMTKGAKATYAKVPPQSWRAGWEKWTVPLHGKHGSTVINGHVGLGNVRGVFANLARLNVHPNAIAYTTDAHGHLHGWRLKSTHLYPKGHLPKIYATGTRYLVLNTCGGELKRMPTVNGTTELLHAKNFQAVFVTAPIHS